MTHNDIKDIYLSSQTHLVNKSKANKKTNEVNRDENRTKENPKGFTKRIY